MTTAVFVLSKNNVLNCQLDNVHATQTQVPGALSPCTCMERVSSLKYNSFLAYEVIGSKGMCLRAHLFRNASSQSNCV